MNDKFSLKKLGETTALGLLDVGLEKVNEATGMSFPLDALTMGRGLLWAGGLIANALTDKGHDYTETLYIAEEPLFIRTLFKAAGVIADYETVPTKGQIELRLRQAGQDVPPRLPGGRAQIR